MADLISFILDIIPSPQQTVMGRNLTWPRSSGVGVPHVWVPVCRRAHWAWGVSQLMDAWSLLVKKGHIHTVTSTSKSSTFGMPKPLLNLLVIPLVLTFSPCCLHSVIFKSQTSYSDTQKLKKYMQRLFLKQFFVYQKVEQIDHSREFPYTSSNFLLPCFLYY